MNDTPSWLPTVLPLVVLAIVMALRLRGLKRARPFRPGTLWILPAVYSAIVIGILAAMPPVFDGWMLFAGGVVIGAVVGWQRARLMRLEVDPVTRQISVRQSPAALLLIFGIMIVRRIAAPTPAASAKGAAASAGALLATDAALGFALGMIVAQRIELWRRARAALAAQPPVAA